MFFMLNFVKDLDVFEHFDKHLTIKLKTKSVSLLRNIFIFVSINLCLGQNKPLQISYGNAGNIVELVLCADKKYVTSSKIICLHYFQKTRPYL